VKIKKGAKSPSFRINRPPERFAARRYSIDLSGFVIASVMAERLWVSKLK
jgi:hypothetical protein